MKFNFKQSIVEPNFYYVSNDCSYTVYDFIKYLEDEMSDAIIKIDTENSYNMKCGVLEKDIHEDLLSKSVDHITVNYGTSHPTYLITTGSKPITQNIINEAINFYLTMNDTFLNYINSIYKETYGQGHIENIQKIVFENNEPILYCNWMDEDGDTGFWRINIKNLKL